MKIDEAIKIKEDMLNHRWLHHPDEVDKADRPSIEALKVIRG